MAIKPAVDDAIKTAMKARDKDRVTALRLIKAEFQRVEVDQKIEINDNLAVDILSKMLKQRRDSERQYKDAGRDELAQQEAYEIELIKTFLPQPLSAEAIDELIAAALEQTQAQGMQDMSKMMAHLKPQLQGRADMGAISKQVKTALQQR